MTFTTTLENFNSNLWAYHIRVPNEAAEVFKQGKERRVICKLNNALEIQCAIMPKGDGTFFINLNKEIRKKLDLGLGEEVTVTLRKDESKYGLPMPEEMAELLKIDDEGNHYFHALTKGKQRSLLHIIGKPKTSDTRLRKALVVVDYLKMTGGKLDFKELNEAFKER